MKSSRLKINNNVVLVFILVLAAILRLYRLNLVPFTFDEYSALFRTQYNNFSCLIKFGVLGDGHPAGIQIFLFYLVKAFGFNEFWIKLPFVIMGIFSVILTYSIAKTWFNETSGLISATFIATLQFPVMYSQIARPYISGLFFSLLMTYFWGRYLFNSNKKIDKNIIIFTIAAILCSYNHYFSLLLALILGISGLFFINKERIIYYISSGLIVFISFIPHIKITLFALNIGGLSWLGKPNFFFFSDYIKYIFNSSILIGLVIALILGISYFYRFKKAGLSKFRIFAIIFFVLPIIIGYVYSITEKPILQFSILIFSFPFLIILLTSYLKEFSAKVNFLIIFLISLITSYSLIFEKKHYTTFYRSGFKEILKENKKVIEKYDNNVTSILLSSKNITNYYLSNNLIGYPFNINNALRDTIKSHDNYLFALAWNNIDSINYFNQPISLKDYQIFLSKQNTDYLYFGWAHNFDWNIFNIIPNYYQHLVYKKYFFNSELYLFSKNESENNSNPSVLFSNVNNFETANKYWTESENITDSISYKGNYSFHISKNNEFSTTFRAHFNSIFTDDFETLHTSVKFYSPNSKCSAYLVFKIENKNKTVKWYYVNLKDFIVKNKKWQTANLLVQVDKIHFALNKQVTVFIWNLNKEEFYIDDFAIKVYPGNKNRFNY